MTNDNFTPPMQAGLEAAAEFDWQAEYKRLLTDHAEVLDALTAYYAWWNEENFGGNTLAEAEEKVADVLRKAGRL